MRRPTHPLTGRVTPADETEVTRRPTLPATAPPSAEVFAVDAHSAQIVWRPRAGRRVELLSDGQVAAEGPADAVTAVDVRGLDPGRAHRLELHVDGRPATTLEIPPLPRLSGEPRVRVATISDLHLGEEGFGLIREMSERRPPGGRRHPLRCAVAAVEEARAWGADILVVKGDITHEGRPAEWDQFDEVLDAAAGIPVVAVPGNHDTVGKHHSVDAATALRRRGLFPDPVQVVDLDQVRVVAVDTTVPGHGYGAIGHHLDELVAAVDVDVPVLVFTHHHLQTTPLPWFWPLGIDRRDGVGALDTLVAVNPDLVVSCGHTHRNRARRHGTALVTEVGATKDHPGVWAGYEIHPDGVRQTVRRVARPDCLAWTERTRRAVGGIWGRWSPGTLADRCVTHRRVRVPARVGQVSAVPVAS